MVGSTPQSDRDAIADPQSPVPKTSNVPTVDVRSVSASLLATGLGIVPAIDKAAPFGAFPNTSMEPRYACRAFLIHTAGGVEYVCGNIVPPILAQCDLFGAEKVYATVT